MSENSSARMWVIAEDSDDTVSAALTVGHGTLHVTNTSLPAGVTVTGEDTGVLTVSGSAAGVNAVLTSLAFTAADYEGPDTLNVTVTSTDGSSTYATTASAATPENELIARPNIASASGRAESQVQMSAP